MTFDEPEYREEQISSVKDFERYQAIMALGINGIIDDWYLERMNYITENGVIYGVAIFKKVMRLTDTR